MNNGKIIVYKDGSHHYHADGNVWEFEADPDYLVTLYISDEELAKIDYEKLNNIKKIVEIPIMEGTLEALNKLSIIK